MVLDTLLNLLPEQNEPKPNKFTIYMGEAIKKAREEAGISQEKLAKEIYLRRATLSDIENGKVEVNSGTLALLGYYLKKPLSYFYPEYLRNELPAENLEPLTYEMILHFEQIYGEELKKLAIQTIKAIEEISLENVVDEIAPYVIARRKREAELKAIYEKEVKKK